MLKLTRFNIFVYFCLPVALSLSLSLSFSFSLSSFDSLLSLPFLSLSSSSDSNQKQRVSCEDVWTDLLLDNDTLSLSAIFSCLSSHLPLPPPPPPPKDQWPQKADVSLSVYLSILSRLFWRRHCALSYFLSFFFSHRPSEDVSPPPPPFYSSMAAAPVAGQRMCRR